MEETKDPKSGVNVSDETETTATPKRDAEATSSATLSDIEDSEKLTGGSSGGSESSGSLEGSTPSPVTEGGGRADGSDSGGPM
ncbi:MAG: hypothetical protein LC754_02145 [Acidobacteria bacterium]|nr:hypothetical protein [Acidobacteriota bacterium]